MKPTERPEPRYKQPAYRPPSLRWWQDAYGVKNWVTLAAICLAFVVLILVSLLVTAWLDHRDNTKWQAFVTEHHCVRVGEKAAQNVVSVGSNPSNGMPVVSVGQVNAQTGWQCNDGITYWR